jgi:hypothetical protein
MLLLFVTCDETKYYFFNSNPFTLIIKTNHNSHKYSSFFFLIYALAMPGLMFCGYKLQKVR